MRRLYRSVDDRFVAGVLGGIAKFFGLDAFLVRVAFLVLIFFSVGTCVLLYIIAWFIIPNEGTVR